MPNNQPTNIVIVLGMHRSGTSAITRGLSTLGIDLGNKLMPPAKDVNDLGFWEDLDINAINIQMLEHVGNDWHHLKTVSTQDISNLLASEYFAKAASLLTQKANGVIPFGFKDPRTSKLLPLWKEIFKHCHLNPAYVIAIRNPLSVCESLKKRDNFPAEKSYRLWLEHTINSVYETSGERRVIVDYDLLLKSPEKQLHRVATTFGLKIDIEAFNSYKNEFLSENLRHNTYKTEDLALDSSAPQLAQQIYTFLLNVALDAETIDAKLVVEKAKQWKTELQNQEYLAILADILSEQSSETINTLNCEISAKSALLEKLQLQLSESKSQLEHADSTIKQHQQNISELTEKLKNSAEESRSLNLKIASDSDKISSFSSLIEEKSHEIESLRHSNNEKINAMRDLEVEIEYLRGVISLILESTSWKITRPMRALKSLFKID